MSRIKVGDTVVWYGKYGEDIPTKTTVLGIDLHESNLHLSTPIPMKEIFTIDKDRCVFDLGNGKWTYGEQIKPIDIIKK